MNLASRPRVLAIFAHPDDESIAAGGTLARFAAEGRETALICATRGEWGPLSDPSLGDYENLGEVREAELRAACDVLGVGWLRFLDLPDAGVRWASPLEGALDRLVRYVRELRPEIVITFGPDGMYGHDDHIAIGALATDAVRLAASPDYITDQPGNPLSAHWITTLYYSAIPQDLMPELVGRAKALDLSSDLWGIAPEQFGIPASEITTRIDIAEYLDIKLKALSCHRTQMTDGHLFLGMSQELASEFLSTEYFRAVNDLDVDSAVLAEHASNQLKHST